MSEPAVGEAESSTRQQPFLRRAVITVLGIALSLFVLVEVNFSLLPPLKEMALFAGAGLILCFLTFPLHPRLASYKTAGAFDWLLVALSVVCYGYLVVYGAQLGQRAGNYLTIDLVIGAVGLVLVLEATRRAIGLALPILAILFILYAHESVARELPDWLFPHRGQDWQDLIGQTYLRTEGVFGTALSVMFRYVFLFVVFGAFLQAAGGTGFIIALATRLFGGRVGGPAKVSVLASGLMGSLSGSAVANAATTGTFTIPLMRSIGFKPHIAAAIEAAASSGGALAPPVMGAGAYMMLEIIHRTPPLTYLEIIRAALIPAVLYYFSIFLLVHFYAKGIDWAGAAASNDRARGDASRARAGDANEDLSAGPQHPSVDEVVEGMSLAGGVTPAVSTHGSVWRSIFSAEGLTFFGALGSLMVFLYLGSSPFRAVTFSLAYVTAMILINPRTPVGLWDRIAAAGVWVAAAAAARFIAPHADTWPDAIIWGLAGALAFGLLSPAWRGMILACFDTSAKGGIPLIVAAACVGIVIGLVARTGIGTAVPQAIIPLAGNSLFLALVAIMGCSIVLGMGLPSAVSYLLLATVIGPVFADPNLGVPILAAHLFIFYFAMMAMVTPPVALAAYATASIAGSGVMQTGMAAFRFSLVGFTLPYMFVYRPELCLMSADGGTPELTGVVLAVTAACLGILSLAAAIAGHLFSPLGWGLRLLLFAAAACALFPDQTAIGPTRLSVIDLIGFALLAVAAVTSFRARGPKAA